MSMTTNSRTRNSRTKHWTLSLDLLEEDDVTKVHAVLYTGGQVLQSRTLARRNPHDTPDSEIGDDFAAGRALVDLGRRLIRAGSIGAEGQGDERLP